MISFPLEEEEEDADGSWAGGGALGAAEGCRGCVFLAGSAAVGYFCRGVSVGRRHDQVDLTAEIRRGNEIG